jgi:hypothetical protein
MPNKHPIFFPRAPGRIEFSIKLLSTSSLPSSTNLFNAVQRFSA